MGGYVCFPGGWMAWLQGRPLLLVNADASLLLSNKALKLPAKKIAFGFAGEAAEAMGKKAVVTGNPVRAVDRGAGRAGRALRRSRAARCACSWSAAAWARGCSTSACRRRSRCCRAAERPEVTHQTGEAAHAARAGRLCRRRHRRPRCCPSSTTCPSGSPRCDLIVCRAGAITVSELCAAGVAAVLVPLIVSTTSHQRDNADWMAGQGAAIHLPQAELSPRKLADLIAGLTRDALQAMATKARSLARPHAAARVADEIEAMVAVA